MAHSKQQKLVDIITRVIKVLSGTVGTGHTCLRRLICHVRSSVMDVRKILKDVESASGNGFCFF